jgi:antitoxin (DNA-binding transcriptional repressor) of toxin-antitoxin stability system
MAIVKAFEAKAHFSDLPDRVARVEETTIAGLGAPVALLVPVEQEESRLSHMEIVDGMRTLRKRVKPGNVSVRQMVAEGRRF